MKSFRDESGQTIVFVALAMSVLLGFAAFATDIGVLLHEQNLIQTAADSAAIAGAKSLHSSTAGAVTTAALNDAALNGFVNGSKGVTITVSNPPSASQVDNAIFAASGFVKVSITKQTAGYFMKIFNLNFMNVSASAVATNKGQSQNCFYVTNPTASAAMQLQGSFKINAPNCGIVIDSKSGDALSFTGAGGTLTAASVEVVGGDSGQTGDSTPAPQLGVTATGDPLSWEQPVNTPSSCTSASSLTGPIGPASFGTVCYSPATSGGTINLNNVTMSPGVYVFNGPVSLSGNVTGVGVTLYLANGGLSATTNSTINLVAPSNPAYQTNGLVIYEARGNTGTIEFEMGNATGSVTGIIYAPSAQLFIHDSGGDSSGGTTVAAMVFDIDLDVNTFYDKTGALTLTSYTQTTGADTSPLTKVTLVQ